LGWNFAPVEGRMVFEPLKWDYVQIVGRSIQYAHTMLCMGTRGAELLSSLGRLPACTFGTEAYEPDLAVATKRLRLLGAKVLRPLPDGGLPFGDSFFDLVINRHEIYVAEEVFRVLKPGGRFITQQVGRMDNVELIRALRAPAPHAEVGRTLECATSELTSLGMRIICQVEALPLVHFYDAGILIYYLKAMPYLVPDFSVDTYFDALCEIHESIQRYGQLSTSSHRWLVEAEKRFDTTH